MSFWIFDSSLLLKLTSLQVLVCVWLVDAYNQWLIEYPCPCFCQATSCIITYHLQTWSQGFFTCTKLPTQMWSENGMLWGTLLDNLGPITHRIYVMFASYSHRSLGWLPAAQRKCFFGPNLTRNFSQVARMLSDFCSTHEPSLRPNVLSRPFRPLV